MPAEPPSTPGRPPSPSARLASLDLLRALAVLLVIGQHVLTPIPAVPGLGAAMALWHRVGWCGVDLFFVLSGYLVAGLLFAEFRKRGHLRVGRFLVRRGFKIYPPFYVFLTAFLLLRLGIGKPVPWRTALSEAAFVQNYGPRWWSHTWSLAVEEHFYLALALGLAWAARRGAPGMARVPFAAAAVCVVVAALRGWTFSTRPWTMDTHYVPTHLRVDALSFGVLLSHAHHFHRDAVDSVVRRLRPGLWIAGAALAAWGCALGKQHLGSFPALYLGFGALLMVSVVPRGKEPVPAGPAVRRLAAVGSWSYSIYLWHYPLVLFADQGFRALAARGLPVPPGAVWALTVVGVVAAGIGAGKAVEGPALALRDRLFPSPAA